MGLHTETGNTIDQNNTKSLAKFNPLKVTAFYHQ